MSGSPEAANEAHSAWPYWTLICMVLFTLSYALGLGIVPWLVQAEIFSGQVRGLGAGLATATNWTTNLLVSSTFLHLVKLITPQGCFGVFSVVSALSCAFTFWHLPETSASVSAIVDEFGSVGRRRKRASGHVYRACDGRGLRLVWAHRRAIDSPLRPMKPQM